MKSYNRFRGGSGCYTCKCCGKRTRKVEEAQDDRYCIECQTALETYNSLLDGCITAEDYLAAVRDISCRNHRHRLDDPSLEPAIDDSVKCCPDCERPNQFGELCARCLEDRASAEEGRRFERLYDGGDV